MDMSDLPLKLESVKYLLPSDLVNELFYNNNGLNQNESDDDKVVNGENEITVQTVIFPQQQSTNVVPIHEDVEKNVQVLPMQQRHTWAQIVKGEPSDRGILSDESFPPLTSTLRSQESKGGKKKQHEEASSSRNETREN
ncbi:hypothetical protein VNO78_19958 [Psophocarpus tetragonolobus]|uniref:Uncharacterized protein n=1 Tax=Psophocarpus tetragonolobus TaxID=3891 RepID=A0AAN9SDK2_PSOTE